MRCFSYKSILFPVIGAALGYAYYFYVGCQDGGGCAITGNPYLSIILGAIFGMAVGSSGKSASSCRIDTDKK